MNKTQKNYHSLIIIAIIIGILFIILNIFFCLSVLDWQASRNEMIEQI